KLLFSDSAETFESHHYAFHVSDAEFDAILQRVKAAGLVFGSAPCALDDAMLNDWNGGRGVYFKDLDGQILELMTVPQRMPDLLVGAGTRMKPALVLEHRS